MNEHNTILQNKKVLLINLGCKVNKYETDAMAEKLRAAGLVIVGQQEIADVCIVNTCSVTNMAQKKSRQMLRRVKKQNEHAVVIAAGCYVNAEHENLLKESFVDIVVGNNMKKDIVQVVAEYFKAQNPNSLDGHQDTACEIEMMHKDYYVPIADTGEYEEMGSLEAAGLDHRRAYIKIQDGCNQFCSYCIIPYTRGRVRSRAPEKILEEVAALAASGVKEFVLTGIHISSYGTDFKEEQAICELGDLICAMEEMPEVRRIRLGSLEPRIITEDFLEQIGKSEKLCPHFHLSLQSACNATLKRMNRKYTIEEYAEKCRLLREYFDTPAITTDVIVGFPGETEEEFEETLSNLEELNLYEIHVFKYSVRSGTAAEKLPDHVPEDIKNIRSDKLLELTRKQKAAFEQSLTGTVDEVLVEERLDGAGESRSLKKAVAIDANEISTDCINIDDMNIDVKEKESKIQKASQYFTGHTKRYVKVCVRADSSQINEIIRVKLV